MHVRVRQQCVHSKPVRQRELQFAASARLPLIDTTTNVLGARHLRGRALQLPVVDDDLQPTARLELRQQLHPANLVRRQLRERRLSVHLGRHDLLFWLQRNDVQRRPVRIGDVQLAAAR